METPSGPAAPVLVIAKTAGLLARSFFPRSPSRPVGQWRPVSADDLLTVAGAAPASHRLPVSPHGEAPSRSEEHTSELQSLMRISYAVFCLKKKKTTSSSYFTIPYAHIPHLISQYKHTLNRS